MMPEYRLLVCFFTSLYCAIIKFRFPFVFVSANSEKREADTDSGHFRSLSLSENVMSVVEENMWSEDFIAWINISWQNSSSDLLFFNNFWGVKLSKLNNCAYFSSYLSWKKSTRS